jgi:hypothetical protein
MLKRSNHLCGFISIHPGLNTSTSPIRAITSLALRTIQPGMRSRNKPRTNRPERAVEVGTTSSNGNADGDDNGDGDQDEEEEEEEEEQQEEQEEEEEGMDLDKETDGAVRSRPVEADQGNAAAGIDHAGAAEEGNVVASRAATEEGDDVTMASEPED